MRYQESDVTADVRFFTASEGGRTTATPPDHHGCIFVYEGENFECRLLLADRDEPVMDHFERDRIDRAAIVIIDPAAGRPDLVHVNALPWYRGE